MRQPPKHYDALMKAEWHYVNAERLGLLCEDRLPSAWQMDQAAREATEHCEALVEQSNPQPTLL